MKLNRTATLLPALLTLALAQGTPAPSPPPLPTPAQARAAGATPNTSYTDARSLQSLVRLARVPGGKGVSLRLGDQELTALMGQRRAFSNGDPVILPGAPFTVGGRSYYPVGLLREMGCSVEAAPGLKGVLAVTCYVGETPKKRLFKKLVF